jgi:hypothetical protein
MPKKNFQQINLGSGQDRKSKSAVNKGMPIIICVCGTRILVVPDLKAMNRAIKNHIAEHKKANNDVILKSLEEFLTKQILIAASKMNIPNKK